LAKGLLNSSPTKKASPAPICGIITNQELLLDLTDSVTRINYQLSSNLPREMSQIVPANILKEAFEIVQENALHKSSVDWHRQKNRLFNSIQNSHLSIDDAHTIVRELLSDIGDGHSHLVTYRNKQSQSETKTQHPESYIVHQNGKKFGYIQVPAFHASKQYTEHQFAIDISSQLGSIDSEQLSGWVVDLQRNHGGNMWPMLAGLAPLLNVSVAGYFRDGDGIDTPWTIGKSHVGIADSVVLDMGQDISPVRQSNLPIAVLTSNSTCSSGEAIVVAFRGSQTSRQFGTPTFGLSTANGSFELSDGSMIWLTTSTFVDSTNREYGSRIFPDESTSLHKNKSAMDLAVDWMNSV